MMTRWGMVLRVIYSILVFYLIVLSGLDILLAKVRGVEDMYLFLFII